VQKQGDQAGINVRNLLGYAHMLHEVNDRFLLLLVNDQMNKARGRDSSM
jgi:hypothetical protein